MSVVSDTPLACRVAPSPNHGERRAPAQNIDTLVLHYTGMESGAAALARLRDPLSEVSAHYLVFEDGEIVQMVPEARRAWHAGAGVWKGSSDINSRSIGIEIVHPGHAGGLPPYPAAQIDAVIALARDILLRWPIPPERVLAHSDIAPERKDDPGETFPWARLAAEGVGHHVAPARFSDGRFFALGDAGQPIEALQAMFVLYGYELPVTGAFDARMRAVVTAFQRHFRQARVDGVADAATITTLRDLIAALPGPASNRITTSEQRDPDRP